ncbi:MAG: hypothetical protein ACOX81_08810 [Candidatus Heteroscillospira sp.]|jgi:hypothetical protein
MGFFGKWPHFVLRLGCSPQANNSTLAPRRVFSATYTPRQKTDLIFFAAPAAKLCETFLTSGNTAHEGGVFSSENE